MTTQYQISNLSQLQEMIDDCLAAARATLGRKVHPDEIAVVCNEFNHITPTLAEVKLSDGSKVFNVEF